MEESLIPEQFSSTWGTKTSSIRRYRTQRLSVQGFLEGLGCVTAGFAVECLMLKSQASLKYYRAFCATK